MSIAFWCGNLAHQFVPVFHFDTNGLIRHKVVGYFNTVVTHTQIQYLHGTAMPFHSMHLATLHGVQDFKPSPMSRYDPSILG